MSTRVFGTTKVLYAIDVEAVTSGSGCVRIEMNISDSRMAHGEPHIIVLQQHEAMALVYALRCDNVSLYLEPQEYCDGLDVSIKYGSTKIVTRNDEVYLDGYDTDLLAKNIEKAALEAVVARADNHEEGCE